MFRRVIALLFLATVGSSAAADEVPPGFLYAGPLLNIHAPGTHGWSLLQSPSQGMEFARAGATKGSSFGAQVLPFEAPEFSTPDAFVDAIRQGARQDSSSDRFRVIDEHYEYDDQRGYPCVRSTSLVEDKEAKVSMFNKMTLLIENHALYCIHPKDNGLGFAAIYSYRGPERHDSLEIEAKNFIGGIQVPGE